MIFINNTFFPFQFATKYGLIDYFCLSENNIYQKKLTFIIKMKNFKHINMEYLDEISEGNQDLACDLIEMFIKQVPIFTEQLDTLYSNGDYVLLGKLAHKIKSSVSMMGISELASDMKNLEFIAKEGKEVEMYPIYIAKFKRITSEAVIELNDILIKLK